MSNRYDKMTDYISSVYNVFQMVNRRVTEQRGRMIGLIIYNYTRYMAKEYNIELKNIAITEEINLIPIFEYISTNDIELYDFSKINPNDVDVTKKDDLERFVLSHIYYITQGNK